MELSSGNRKKAWACCRQCGEAEVLRSADCDLLPREDRRAALVEFFQRHTGHTVTVVTTTTPEAILYSGPTWDPRTVVWIEVTDGRGRYVLETFRSSIAEPRRYRLRKARIVSMGVAVQLDPVEALRAWHQRFSSAGHQKLGERLLALAQELVASVDPADLRPEFEDVERPGVAFCSWPSALLAVLELRGREMLPPALRGNWEEFVAEQCQAYGAWAIRLNARARLAEEESRVAAPL